MKSLALCMIIYYLDFVFEILFFVQLVSADQFRYTSEGNAITIKGVNDAQQFSETREALALLGLFDFSYYFCF